MRLRIAIWLYARAIRLSPVIVVLIRNAIVTQLAAEQQAHQAAVQHQQAVAQRAARQ